MKAPIKKQRCAIYTRKSSEEGLEMEFNSLDAQRDACEAFIASQRHEGWLALDRTYDDGGYSGGTLERPALKQLILDIEAGKVDVIVVYKIDRLSRSLMDFAKLVEVFDRNNVTFVSVTQSFNTTTSMGRLTLNILLSFAQFEREVIGERIRDKVAASKRKGIWMGGVTPFGYIVRDRQLLIEPEQALAVQKIFETFLILKSVAHTARELPKLGVVSRRRMTQSGREFGATPFDRSAIYKILNNPIYLGKLTHKGDLFDGRHTSIISQDVWDKVQDTLRVSPRTKSASSKRKSRAPLTGLLKCGTCNCSMTPVHSKNDSGKLYRYYSGVGYVKGRCPDCPTKRVAARDIEALVVMQLQDIFAEPEMIVAVWREITNTDPSIDNNAVRDALSDLMPIWNELFPKEQERLIALMLQSLVVYPDSVDIRIRADGLKSLVKELDRQKKRLEDQHDPTYNVAA